MTSEQIARAMAIPDRHALMVLKQLISAGLVCSYSCIARGYELSRELEEISLWDIYMTTEETMSVTPCLVDQDYCSRKAAETCLVRRFYTKFQRALELQLQKVSLADILRM